MTTLAERENKAVLQVADLRLGYARRDRSVAWVLQADSVSVRRGEVVGMIGRSGSGKTSLCRAILGLLGPPAVVQGNVRRIRSLDDHQCGRTNSGNHVGYVPQNPSSALHPMIPVGRSMLDVIRTGIERNQALDRARLLLEEVGFADADTVLASYPDMLSVGMKQRVLIALALAADSPLLILDEPTAANDAIATYECARILDRCRTKGIGIIVASHDLAFIEAVSDHVLFIEEGQLKQGNGGTTLRKLITHGIRHLVEDYVELHGIAVRPSENAAPGMTKAGAPARPDLLRLEHVTQEYHRRGVRTVALRDFSLEIGCGERVAIVGRSGAGKSTLARLLAGIEHPTRGAALFNGEQIPALGERGFVQHACRVQYIPQNASGSLNPALRVSTVIREVLKNLGLPRSQQGDAVERHLRAVALPAEFASSFVTELSEGQRQRVAVARALATGCRVIIADECFSGLDAETASEVISTFKMLHFSSGLGIIYITHDITMVPSLANRVIVVEEGQVVEDGPPGQLLGTPRHPFTQMLVKASQWSGWPRRMTPVGVGQGD